MITVKRADGGVLDHWSIFDMGLVRVAIVAENSPDLIIVRGCLPPGSQGLVRQLIAHEKAIEAAKIRK